MQRILFFLVLLVFLILFFFANKYVVLRATQALAGTKFQSIFKISYWFFPIFFFIGQVLERGEPSKFVKIISNIGSIWLGWFLYALLAVILIDLIRLIFHAVSFSPKQLFEGVSNGFLTFLIVFVGLTGLIIYGVLNAYSPHIVKHEISTEKPLEKELKIAVATDLHMGAIRSRKSIQKMADLINETSPDMVLFVGDLVDHNPRFAIKDNMGEIFERIHAPLGLYAVTGNHEYIGHAETSIEYLSKHGVSYLRDSLTSINEHIILAGREDKQMQMATSKKRKSIQDILGDNNTSDKFFILMDHQPVEYDNAVDAGIDLMLSGHTHKGQMWPNNFITKLVFENHYGLLQKAKTRFYTSNGFGTWGPPIRIGNRPEVVLLSIVPAK